MAAKLANLQAQKKFQLTAIGVGDDADMNVLQQLSPITAKLKGTNFTDFFQWLSASVSMVSQSIPGDDRGVSLPDIDFWAALKYQKQHLPHLQHSKCSRWGIISEKTLRHYPKRKKKDKENTHERLLPHEAHYPLNH